MRFRFFLRFLAIAFALTLAVLAGRGYLLEEKVEKPAKVVSASTSPQPGTYLREGGSGELVISKDTGGDLAFTLKTKDANGDACTLDGVMQAGKAVLRDKDGKEGCTITFTSRENGVEVQAADEKADNKNGLCRYDCKAGVSFSGLYLKSPSS
ncbi:MAG: hypothetical protein FWG01_04355 [Betaproteobacteria bacterium]|nr:hypothetical protein [Betaproteobacteria bacterium]